MHWVERREHATRYATWSQAATEWESWVKGTSAAGRHDIEVRLSIVAADALGPAGIVCQVLPARYRDRSFFSVRTSTSRPTNVLTSSPPADAAFPRKAT